MSFKKLTPFASLFLIVIFFVSGCSPGKTYITTSVGEIAIKRSEIVYEFAGSNVVSGSKLLLIFFESKDGETVDGLYEAGQKVIVTDSSGRKFDMGVGGIHQRENFLGFLIPESTTDLMLVWPGNDPIAIEIQEQ